MGESISIARADTRQQTAARTALAQMCNSIAKAIIEVAKLEGPLQSEEVVAQASTEVLKLCKTQTERTTGEIIQVIRREKLGRAMQVAAFNKAQTDLLFLELLRVALNDSDDDDDDDGPTTSSSSGSGSGAVSRQRPQTARREVSIAHPWTKLKALGRGAYGVVYSAKDRNGLNFAVKEVAKDSVEEKSLRDEVQLLGQLNHRNIVRFYGCAGDEEKVFMYMELMNGSVKDEMVKTGKAIPGSRAQKYTKDVLQGLVYLHSKNIVHCDIKCANVLLTSDGTAKLADMGISRKHNHATMLEASGETAGTLLWMSPEQLSGCQGGKRSDVWSLGCTVYEMVTGAPPFEKELAPILYALVLPKMIENLEHRKLVQSNDNMPPPLKDFLLKIFVKMDSRPFAEQITNEPWVR